jgi:hypothetical protein
MSIKIPIISDFDGKGIKKAIAEFKQLETTSEKAQFAIKKAALPATAALGALAAGMKTTVVAASDLQEAQSKVNIIFGEGAKDVEAFAKTTAKSLGISRREALKTAGVFGTFGKAAGLSGGGLAKFTSEFTTLAADLASFNNTTPEDAIQAIGAAMRGEAEPIRRYGVLLDDAALRTRALEMKIYDGNGALTAQQKVLAASQEILAQTTSAQGDAIRTGDGLANSAKQITAQMDDLKTAIGDGLLPVVEEVLPVIKDFADWAVDNPKTFRNIALAIGAIAAATVALNIAMAVNPYVAAAGGIAAMAAAFDYLYREVDKVNKIGGIGARVLGAIFGGPAGAISGMKKLQEAVWGVFGITSKGVAQLTKAQIEQNEINQLVASGLVTLDTANKNFTNSTSESTKTVDKSIAKIKELRKEIRGDFKTALEEASKRLQTAKDKFNDFAKSVSDAITGTFSFGNAQNTASDNAKKLNDALSRQTKAQEKVNRLQSEGASDQLTEAMAELRDVTNEVVEAQSKPMTFLDTLTQQANKTKDFGVQLNRLLAAGLSEDALQQVLAAGLDAGSLIADELLNGGADAISKANTLTAEIQTLGDTVGTNAAVQFRQAGVDAGTALVEGINQAIANFQLKLTSKKLSARQLARLQKNFGVEVDFLMSSGQIPALANGGIVKASPGGTLALIGEGGRDEAVIPLDRAGGMGNNVTINVNGGDPQAVVDALRRYMQLNGSVPIRVS